MSQKKLKLISFVFVFISSFIFTASVYAKAPEAWSYDPGPNPQTEMGQELIDLNAAIPNMPAVSLKISGKQKFRPAYGPIPWRMPQEPNSVKILFIGQDGTHIAEAAGRPATAGFGGRAQDFANYFGVDYGAAFINTYAFTIRGQYSERNTPYIYSEDGEEPELRFGGIVRNGTWLVTQDQKSPVVKWRNSLIDWIIRNNKDSLKLVVLFGGSAKDSIASYIESKGGEVGVGRYVPDLEKVKVPMTANKYAGGNNQLPVPLNKHGEDLYAELLGKKSLSYTNAKNVTAAQKALKENLSEAIDKMVFTHGGQDGSGLVHPAQMGGYDLSTIKVNGKKTRSLKGLPLSDGTEVTEDILVVQFPHPTYLSMTKMDADKNCAKMKKEGKPCKKTGGQLVTEMMMKKINLLKPYKKKGWEIKADHGQVNNFEKGEDYKYLRADIGPEYYDFGAPANRMVSVSSAKRLTRVGGKSTGGNVILFGSRDTPKFDADKVWEMAEIKPAAKLPSAELFTARPRTPELRYTFDPGPGEDYAKMMIQNLDLKKIFKTKSGKSFKKDGIAAYNVKSHPDASDFGHYRGTFKDPRVLILADPDGYDDLMTSRALTGARGQYLQALLEEVGYYDEYLVIKTVPFSMDNASETEWNKVLKQTEAYREKLIDTVTSENQNIELILTDGEYAAEEMTRILDELGIEASVVNINREAYGNDSGLEAAADAISDLPGFSTVLAPGVRANIPRSHLSYYARAWEGTSGDSVITASDKMKGKAFIMVAPYWAAKQKAGLQNAVKKQADKVIEQIEEYNLPLPGESIPKFLKRKFGTDVKKESPPQWNTIFQNDWRVQPAS